MDFRVRLWAAVLAMVLPASVVVAKTTVVPRYQEGTFTSYPSSYALYRALEKSIAAFPSKSEMDLTTLISRSLDELRTASGLLDRQLPSSMTIERPSWDQHVGAIQSLVSREHRAALLEVGGKIEDEAVRQTAFVADLSQEYWQGLRLSQAIDDAWTGAEKLRSGTEASSAVSSQIGEVRSAFSNLGLNQLRSIATVERYVAQETSVLSAVGLKASAVPTLSQDVPKPTLISASGGTMTWSTKVPQQILLAAELSHQVYDEKGSGPNVLRLEDGVRGFKAAAYIFGDELIVAYAGTQPTDINDLTADFELAVDAFTSTNSVGGLATDGLLPLNDSALDSQIVQAQRFFRTAQSAFASKYGAQPKTTLVVGHSLGGLLSQIVGARFGVPTRTFNSPGVPNLTARRHGIVINRSLDIVNIGRREDLVFNLATHFGDKVQIAGVEQSIPAEDGNLDLGEAVSRALRNHEIEGIAPTWAGNPNGILATDRGAESMRAAAAVGQPPAQDTSPTSPPAAQGDGDSGKKDLQDKTDKVRDPSPSAHEDRKTFVSKVYQRPDGSIYYRNYLRDEDTGELTPYTEQEQKDPTKDENKGTEDDKPPPSAGDDSYTPADDTPKCELECVRMLDNLVQIVSTFQLQFLEPEMPTGFCESDPACDPNDLIGEGHRLAEKQIATQYGCWADPACDPIPEDLKGGATSQNWVRRAEDAKAFCQNDGACDPQPVSTVLSELHRQPLALGLLIGLPEGIRVFSNVLAPASIGGGPVPPLPSGIVGAPGPGDVMLGGHGYGTQLGSGGLPSGDDALAQSQQYDYSCMAIQTSDPKGYEKCRELACDAKLYSLELGLVEVPMPSAGPAKLPHTSRTFSRKEYDQSLIYAGSLNESDRSEYLASLILGLFPERPFDSCVHRALISAAVRAFDRYKTDCKEALAEADDRVARLDFGPQWVIGRQGEVVSSLARLGLGWADVARIFHFDQSESCYASEARKRYGSLFR